MKIKTFWIAKTGFYQTRNGKVAEVIALVRSAIGTFATGQVDGEGLSWNQGGEAENSQHHLDLVRYVGKMVDASKIEEGRILGQLRKD